MKYTKEQIESSLKELLRECLESANQESAIVSLDYDPDIKQVNIVMNACIIEEDDYIGFEGY